MEEQAKKVTWGGKRREGTSQTPKNFKIDNDLLDFLDKQPNKNRFLNELIRVQQRKAEFESIANSILGPGKQTLSKATKSKLVKKASAMVKKISVSADGAIVGIPVEDIKTGVFYTVTFSPSIDQKSWNLIDVR